MKNKDIVYPAVFAVLISISSWISIPLAVPVTLQLFAVCLATTILGRKKACYAVFVYVILGAFGLPVFAGFRGGFQVLFGPTGGYILGLFAVAAVGGNAKNNIVNFVRLLLGTCICYAIGTIWFSINQNTGIIQTLSVCVLPFVIPDILKIVLAIILSEKIKKITAL